MLQCSMNHCLQTKHSADLDTQSLYKNKPQLSMRIEYVSYFLHKMSPWLIVYCYNSIQILSWRANVDMKYLVSKEKVVEYCTKYATKSEPRFGKHFKL